MDLQLSSARAECEKASIGRASSLLTRDFLYKMNLSVHTAMVSWVLELRLLALVRTIASASYRDDCLGDRKAATISARSRSSRHWR